MSLKDYCIDTIRTCGNGKVSDENIGLRVMCPEYSINQIDVKHFTEAAKGEVFVILWYIENEHLSAAILLQVLLFMPPCVPLRNLSAITVFLNPAL